MIVKIKKYWLSIRQMVQCYILDIKSQIKKRLQDLNTILKKVFTWLKPKNVFILGGTNYYYGFPLYPRFWLISNTVYTRKSKDIILRFLYSKKSESFKNYHYIKQVQKKNTGPFVWYILYNVFLIWGFLGTGKWKISRYTVPFEIEAIIYRNHISEFHGTKWIDWVMDPSQRLKVYKQLEPLILK